MEKTYGEAKTRALTKYAGVLAPTEADLTEMLTLLFPSAPEQDKKRALLLCLSYKLNPLANHVYLIPFKDTWVLVQSIKAKRLLASRRGPFSYVDNTPRVMTEAEQTQIFGELQPDRLWAITKLKDTTTGAEAVGYGFYLKKEQPYGTEKGNSRQNMAFIRSESQAIDRLRPSEMPTGIEVMPEEAAESAIEAEYKLLAEEPEPTAKGTEADEVANEPELEPEPEPEPTPELGFDPEWLKDSLKQLHWNDSTVKSYLKNIFKVDTEGTIVEVVTRLSREDKGKFFKEITDRLDMLEAH